MHPEEKTLDQLFEQAVDRRLDRLVALVPPSQTAKRLKAQETAGHFKVHPKTVRNWLKAGCPAIFVGQRPRFLLAEVEEWLRVRPDGRAEWRKAAK